MVKDQTKRILRYTLLPEALPRFREIFALGFNYIPYYIALVYNLVRLLPDNHPYLRAENFGKYGIRHVIAEAANHLVISRDNIDQIIMFLVVFMGLIMTVMQVALLLFGLLIPSAAAQVSGFNNGALGQITHFFALGDGSIQASANDLAMMMLDMVFGVPDMFNSCIATTEKCVTTSGALIDHSIFAQMNSQPFPYPTHNGLHALFNFYNTGLLTIAVLITSYFIATVVAETAQTGTPFGKRFNKVWAPVRLVVAIGMLVPISYGMNASQYIVLYAAKYGSNFASNGWNVFTGTLFNMTNQEEAPKAVGGGESLITAPHAPRLKGFLQFLYTARVCAEAYEMTREATQPGSIDKKFGIYVMRPGAHDTMTGYYKLDDVTNFSDSARSADDIAITAYQSGENSYEKLIDFAEGHDHVTVRFGYRDLQSQEKYNIVPLCGDMAFHLVDSRPIDDGGASTDPHKYASRAVEIMQRTYWIIWQHAWYDAFYRNINFDDTTADDDGHPFALYTFCNANRNRSCADTTISGEQQFPKNYPENLSHLISFYQKVINSALWQPKDLYDGVDISGISGIGEDGAVIELNKELRTDDFETLAQKGWGGAALWYNKIAEMNGILASAVYNEPSVMSYPWVMELVARLKGEVEENIPPGEEFQPTFAGGKEIPIPGAEIEKIKAQAMWQAYELWGKTEVEKYNTGNPVIAYINSLFGVEGLYSLRDNKGTHPLAQIAAVGRSLVQATANSLFGILTGKLLSSAGVAEGISASITGILSTIAIISLTLGFVLYYVIPFLPFLYFFFAMSGWVKGIFEAMVGAPLWALAHIRIDGNGLPGEAAKSGYFLIFEIFLRPILIVFGLVASVSIFAAMVNILHDVWAIATENVAGGSEDTAGALQQGLAALGLDTGGKTLGDWTRAPIDQFFYTVMYAVVVYMMGMSCFKLIDTIPNQILRWMGQSVQTFNDSRDDIAANMVQQSYIGGQQAISGLGGALKSAGGKGG
ncbi:MAG: DotA/TraY family protein [Pseudomonadota bacterium]